MATLNHAHASRIVDGILSPFPASGLYDARPSERERKVRAAAQYADLAVRCEALGAYARAAELWAEVEDLSPYGGWKEFRTVS